MQQEQPEGRLVWMLSELSMGMSPLELPVARTGRRPVRLQILMGLLRPIVDVVAFGLAHDRAAAVITDIFERDGASDHPVTWNPVDLLADRDWSHLYRAPEQHRAGRRYKRVPPACVGRRDGRSRAVQLCLGFIGRLGERGDQEAHPPVTPLLMSGHGEGLLGYPLTYIGFWALGLSRHAYLVRAEQAERMLAEARRARDAETQAAALAERARMAREIHDVLAHSLAAVSVNLQAAEGLLAALPTGSPELAKAIECIDRAEVFTRDGLAEARRAILALRDDAPPAARPAVGTGRGVPRRR